LPGSLSLSDIDFDCLSSKLVVNEAAESDAITKGLKWRNWVVEDDHRSYDQKDILENTG
jgi:hypothetical protein